MKEIREMAMAKVKKAWFCTSCGSAHPAGTRA